jgi:hypothetical protein
VLLLDQPATRADPEAMRLFAEHNATVVLFPLLRSHVLTPVDLASA